MTATSRAREALEASRERRIGHMRALLSDLGEAEWRRLDEATALLEEALRR